MVTLGAEGHWRKARVNPRYEHWYWVQPKVDREAFLALVDLIRAEGEPGKFAKTRYRYLTVGEFVYWVTRSFYDRDAVLINRRRADTIRATGDRSQTPVREIGVRLRFVSRGSWNKIVPTLRLVLAPLTTQPPPGPTCAGAAHNRWNRRRDRWKSSWPRSGRTSIGKWS